MMFYIGTPAISAFLSAGLFFQSNLMMPFNLSVFKKPISI